MLRELIRASRIQTRQVGRSAAQYHRALRYGLDLVLWSRLFSQRGPVPNELPDELLATKSVFHRPPMLHVTSGDDRCAYWPDAFSNVYSNLFLNLQVPDILSELRYAHPAPSFAGIYLWDSAFIAQCWKHWDSKTALEINRAVFNVRDGDRFQHVVTNFSQSKFTQPPVMAWSVQRLRDWQQELSEAEFVNTIYQPLVNFHHWLNTFRRHDNNLYFWAHPYESGIDNSPRFSSRDEKIISNTKRFSSPDITAYVAMQSQMLALLADDLMLSDAAKAFRARNDVICTQMNALLWDNTDAFYYDLDETTGQFIRSKTIAGLIPLWAGIPDRQQAQRLCSQILNTHQFNTPIPLPSVSRDNIEFEKDMWRGPVWINMAYLTILGLERYGYLKEVAHLSFQLCDGVYRTFDHLRRFFEFYDPDRFDLTELNRKQGNWFKLITLGNKPVSEFVGWTGLVNSLVIEQLIGLRHGNGKTTIAPNFPDAAQGLGFSLTLPEKQIAISLEILNDGKSRCFLHDKDQKKELHLQTSSHLDTDFTRLPDLQHAVVIEKSDPF